MKPSQPPRMRDIFPIHRGDIFMADLDPVVGFEQGGVRPVLVVNSDEGNLRSPCVVVVPLTSAKPKLFRVHVPVPATLQTGLEVESYALCEKPRDIDRQRLRQYMGRAPAEVMVEINRALRTALDLEGRSSRGTQRRERRGSG